MTDAPAKYTEIEQQLGQPLAALIGQRRAEGVSWRRIAREVRDRTGVGVSYEALRIWTEGRAPVAATTPPGTPRPSTPPQTPRPPAGPGRLVALTSGS